MSQFENQELERATVYLTRRNKQRLMKLRRGEKAQKLNEALDRAFEEEERIRAFDEFLERIEKITPVEPRMPTSEIIRLIREGRHDELDDRLISNP